MKRIALLFLMLGALLAHAQKARLNAEGRQVKPNSNKEAIGKSVDKHRQELISVSDKIWAYAETALKEYKS